VKWDNKPNSNPIQTQSKPILAQYQGWQRQFKAKQSQFQTLFCKNWELSMSPVEDVILNCIIDDYGNIQIEL
jgi:hypothetical protein